MHSDQIRRKLDIWGKVISQGLAFGRKSTLMGLENHSSDLNNILSFI